MHVVHCFNDCTHRLGLQKLRLATSRTPSFSSSSHTPSALSRKSRSLSISSLDGELSLSNSFHTQEDVCNRNSSPTTAASVDHERAKELLHVSADEDDEAADDSDSSFEQKFEETFAGVELAVRTRLFRTFLVQRLLGVLFSSALSTTSKRGTTVLTFVIV